MVFPLEGITKEGVFAILIVAFALAYMINSICEVIVSISSHTVIKSEKRLRIWQIRERMQKSKQG